MFASAITARTATFACRFCKWRLWTHAAIVRIVAAPLTHRTSHICCSLAECASGPDSPPGSSAVR